MWCLANNERVHVTGISCAGSLDLEPASYFGSIAPPPDTVISLVNSLPNLAYATQGGLSASANTFLVPLGYSFDGFPSGVIYARDSIQVQGTSALDLSFLSNVICAPIFLGITNNAQLTSLNGINIWPVGSLVSIEASGNPLLTRQGYAPLGPVLQCDTQTPANVEVNVETVDCPRMTTVAELCAYITTGCPIPP